VNILWPSPVRSQPLGLPPRERALRDQREGSSEQQQGNVDAEDRPAERLRRLSDPAATPRSADAGIVVTEIATSIAELALVSSATVRFAFDQLLPGRKLTNGKCVAQTARNRRDKVCTRSVPRGSLSFNAGAGLHRLFFQGRVTRTRKLQPGTYALTITATNAAGQRATKTLRSFTIVPG
jgi:hypothetical protein